MPPRSLLIDALKLLASQLIVLHHIVLYAPMAALVAPSRPALAGLLANEARWAVQIFLVVGGFLCAQALSLYRPSLPQLPRALLGRWLRLVPVLAVALLCVLAASALLPRGQWPDWVTPWPTPGAFAAHLLLLQDVLGIAPLSAGVWYVAIDFQLFALLMAGAALPHRGAAVPVWRTALPWMVATLTLASLWRFNREPALEAWAPYFFGAYGLGALAAWAPRSRAMAALFGAVLWLQLLDAALEARPRVLVACLSALALAVWASQRTVQPARRAANGLGRWLARCADASYGVFVIHYAVIIAATALWLRLDARGPAAAWALLLATWAASLAAGAALHRHVGLRWSLARRHRLSRAGA